MTVDPAAASADRAFSWGLGITVLATALRLTWVLTVPTVPVGDFAMYRESANYLSEFGSLDHGFIYMPGFVILLAAIKDLGGDLLAQKLLGVFFGGIGAAGVFVTALHTFDRDGRGGRGRRGGRRGRRSCATAIVAGLAYALWPAGIAMASVVGTDVPAAALIVVATGCLTGWGTTRPRLAALAFGVVMGLAAYIRAVALPLTALSGVYWLVTRRRPLAAARLTALSVATTLLVLSPWAIRNARHEGQLSFTDYHGGITALIGTNPNSEGTYTRALNQLFHDVTGHSVLDEPHRQIDRAAFRLAQDWARFEPAYAAGLAILRAQRLFDDEHLSLYWPIYRPGVLVPPHNAFFERHRQGLSDAADVVGLAILGTFLAGLGLAASERRWPGFALLPFQLALAATYVVFFAEPRYRIPIEMLALPVAAYAVVGFGRLGVAAAGRGDDSGDGQSGNAGATARARVGVLRGAVVAALLVAAVFGLAPHLWAAGARVRQQHRWAVTPWLVDGQTRLARWRRTPVDLAKGGGQVVLAGAPDGVRVRPHEDGRAEVEVWLDGDDLAAGDFRFEATVVAGEPAKANATERTLTIQTDGPFAASTRSFVVRLPPDLGVEVSASGVVHHSGGPFHVLVTVSAPTDVWITNARLVSAAKQLRGGHIDQ